MDEFKFVQTLRKAVSHHRHWTGSIVKIIYDEDVEQFPHLNNINFDVVSLDDLIMIRWSPRKWFSFWDIDLEKPLRKRDNNDLGSLILLNKVFAILVSQDKISLYNPYHYIYDVLDDLGTSATGYGSFIRAVVLINGFETVSSELKFLAKNKLVITAQAPSLDLILEEVTQISVSVHFGNREFFLTSNSTDSDWMIFPDGISRIRNFPARPGHGEMSLHISGALTLSVEFPEDAFVPAFREMFYDGDVHLVSATDKGPMPAEFMMDYAKTLNVAINVIMGTSNTLDYIKFEDGALKYTTIPGSSYEPFFYKADIPLPITTLQNKSVKAAIKRLEEIEKKPFHRRTDEEIQEHSRLSLLILRAQNPTLDCQLCKTSKAAFMAHNIHPICKPCAAIHFKKK